MSEQPLYPKHCPRCGERVYPLSMTDTYSAPLPPVEQWRWFWVARCWLGHLVEPELQQMSLL